MSELKPVYRLLLNEPFSRLSNRFHKRVQFESPAKVQRPFRSLLVRSVNWVGDAVMTTPALQRLRERLPEAQIALLTQEKLADLWHQHPCIDSLIIFRDGENPWSIGRRLRSRAFETALILPNSPRSALETWLARIPRRIGYAATWRNLFLTDPVPYPGDRVRLRKLRVSEVRRSIDLNLAPSRQAARYVHQMRDYLDLGAILGANAAPLPPSLHVTEKEAEAAVLDLLSNFPGSEVCKSSPTIRTLLGINPCAAYGPAKRWPADKFGEVMKEVSKQVPNCVWLIFGSGSDREYCERFCAFEAGSIFNLAGKTSLRQMMAFLKKCRVLLTNDSGPMHVAAALGTPVVALFGSTSPELTAPGQPGDPRHHLLRAKVPCSPCFRRTCPIDFRCMNGIGIERAVSAVLETLKSKFEA